MDLCRYWQLDPARASALVDTTQPLDAHDPSQAWDETLEVSFVMLLFMSALCVMHHADVPSSDFLLPKLMKISRFEVMAFCEKYCQQLCQAHVAICHVLSDSIGYA